MLGKNMFFEIFVLLNVLYFKICSFGNICNILVIVEGLILEDWYIFRYFNLG